MTGRWLVLCVFVMAGMTGVSMAAALSPLPPALVSDDFESCTPGSSVSHGHWTTDWPGTMHIIAAAATGKALAVKAVNGTNSRINFDAQEGGVLKCTFDWQPQRGQWTFVGFKAPDAAWDKYQAAVLFGPVGGHIYTFKGSGQEKISTQPLRLGDATSAAVYHVTMIVQPRAADKKPGRYRIEVTGQEGVVAATAFLPFSSDAEAPISLFEIRSIKWCEPKGDVNGYLDNLRIQQDVTAVPVTLKVAGDKWGHLYYHGKPVTLLVTLTNLTDKSVEAPAVLTVADPYGKAILEKARTLTVAAKDNATWQESLPAAAVDLYGLYRVRAGAGPASTRIYQKTTFAVIAPPNNEASSFDSHFGAFQYPLTEEKPYLDKIVGQMYDLGIRWLRVNFHWNNHEPEKGKFDWDGGSFPMGTFTDLAYNHNMHVMAELAYTARWASSKAHDERVGAIDTGTFWMSVAPKNFADWENYCRKAAERFKGKVKYYEVWNEPGAPKNYKDFNGFWRDSSDNFIRLINTANKAVKAVDPKAKICAAGFRGVDMGDYFDNFVERVLPGVIRSIDVVSFHGWGAGGWGTKLYNFKLLAEKLGRTDLVYFDTESPGLGLESSGLVKGYVEDWSKGIAKSFGFIYNLPRYGHTSLVHPDYTPDVGAVAFATMTRFLEGAKMEGPLTPGEGVRAYSFLKGTDRIVVAWSEVPDKVLTADIGSADHTFDFQGNPGPKVTPGEYRINKIQVGNDPVYIFCKLDLDLKGIPDAKAR